jgi:UDP-glucose 4-epimerase
MDHRVKILITGARGFIGRNLAEPYASSHQVEAPPRATLDLLDAVAVREYLERHRFDAVIHAATERSNRALSGAPDLLQRNCRMFFNLARNPHAFGRMLFLSSGAVYDRARLPPLATEEDFDVRVPSEDYGFSKYVCAKSIRPDGQVYELRLFGVFGPYEDWRVRFISNACCRAVWDLPVVIRQNVVFDYLDVADLARILEHFMTGSFRYRHYNVSTGRPVDLKTLAAEVVEASGKPLDTIVQKEGLGSEYTGDNRRLLAELSPFRFRERRESVARLYRWYASRKADIDPRLLGFDQSDQSSSGPASQSSVH